MLIDRQTAAKAERVFLDPAPVYPWDDVVTGVRVRGATLQAVGTNTFRGFHRVDKSRPGAKPVFEGYFVRNRPTLLEGLRAARSGDDLEGVAGRAVRDLVGALDGVVRADQLRSYNKVRKPVDLYLEHLVAMAEEFDRGDRERLVPLLSLPLDSQVFQSETCFTYAELGRHGLRRTSTFKDVGSERTYRALQGIISEKARRVGDGVGAPFHRVYFDLVWNGRWRRTGGNLFELDPRFA